MMRPRHLLAAAMLLGLGACSALRPDTPIERDAAHRLDRGLAALDAGQYRAAFDDLAWVYAHCHDHARGAEALVGLAALELDPRNRAARPGLATDLLGRVIREPASPDFVRPLAESTYLLALALGAPAASDTLTRPDAWPVVDSVARWPAGVAAPADSAARPPVGRPAAALTPPDGAPAYGCGPRISPRAWAAPRLPGFPGPSMAERVAAAEQSRGTVAAEAEGLRRELAAAQQKLQETEAELERIRKTLKP
ncbi:MAG TPA: hypothetical protein VMM12_02655 [Longimicrobiales bacterium]|nr:hypothetical protein [Longimicrobiales bacterium]